MTSHAVHALRRRYAETLGRIKATDGDPDGLQTDLEHLGAVLCMFDDKADLAAIQPIRPWTNRRGKGGAVWLQNGLTVLGAANEPMSVFRLAKVTPFSGISASKNDPLSLRL